MLVGDTLCAPKRNGKTDFQEEDPRALRLQLFIGG